MYGIAKIQNNGLRLLMQTGTRPNMMMVRSYSSDMFPLMTVEFGEYKYIGGECFIPLDIDGNCRVIKMYAHFPQRCHTKTYLLSDAVYCSRTIVGVSEFISDIAGGFTKLWKGIVESETSIVTGLHAEISTDDETYNHNLFISCGDECEIEIRGCLHNKEFFLSAFVIAETDDSRTMGERVVKVALLTMRPAYWIGLGKALL